MISGDWEVNQGQTSILCYLLAVGPGANSLPSLGLIVGIYKVKPIRLLANNRIKLERVVWTLEQLPCLIVPWRIQRGCLKRERPGDVGKSVKRTCLRGEVSRFRRKGGWLNGLLGTRLPSPPSTPGKRTFLPGLLVPPGTWDPGLHGSPAHLGVNRLLPFL